MFQNGGRIPFSIAIVYDKEKIKVIKLKIGWNLWVKVKASGDSDITQVVHYSYL